MLRTPPTRATHSAHTRHRTEQLAPRTALRTPPTRATQSPHTPHSRHTLCSAHTPLAPHTVPTQGTAQGNSRHPPQSAICAPTMLRIAPRTWSRRAWARGGEKGGVLCSVAETPSQRHFHTSAPSQRRFHTPLTLRLAAHAYATPRRPRFAAPLRRGARHLGGGARGGFEGGPGERQHPPKQLRRHLVELGCPRPASHARQTGAPATVQPAPAYRRPARDDALYRRGWSNASGNAGQTREARGIAGRTLEELLVKREKGYWTGNGRTLEALLVKQQRRYWSNNRGVTGQTTGALLVKQQGRYWSNAKRVTGKKQRRHVRSHSSSRI